MRIKVARIRNGAASHATMIIMLAISAVSRLPDYAHRTTAASGLLGITDVKNWSEQFAES